MPPMGPRGPKGMKGGPKSKDPVKTLKRLLAFIMKRYKFRYMIVLVCIAVSSIVQVIGTMFMKSLIDDYIIPMVDGRIQTFQPLIEALTTIGCVYLLGIVCTYAYNMIMMYVAQGVLKDVRDEMFAHMESLPIKYFDTHQHGDIMSHYTNDTDTLRQMVSQSIPNLFSSAITLISTLISMLILSVPLTFLVLLGVVVMLMVSGKIGGNSAKYFIAQQQALGKTNGYIEEMMDGQKVIKVFCHEDKTVEEFNRLNDELFDTARNANTFANILMPVNANIGNINYVVILVAGSLLAIHGFGGLTLGALASFLQLAKSFNHPISQVAQQFNSIVMALAGAERIFELMDEPVTVTDEPNAKVLPEMKGDVKFEHVVFEYEKDRPILKDVSFHAKAGESIALVGPTGAGKSTVVNLVSRFYNIKSGKVLIDDEDISKVTLRSIRSQMGIMLQDSFIFSGTIMDNIRYGRLDATDEECIEAAKRVYADEFIRKLPNGYYTEVNERGDELSVGQRQLLSFARTLLSNPKILILDEATSSIDTKTELLVQEGIKQLLKDRTSFIVAHRISTIKGCDRIMYISGGTIAESGNHEELMQKKGYYYQLYNSQLTND